LQDVAFEPRPKEKKNNALKSNALKNNAFKNNDLENNVATANPAPHIADLIGASLMLTLSMGCGNRSAFSCSP